MLTIWKWGVNPKDGVICNLRIWLVHDTKHWQTGETAWRRRMHPSRMRTDHCSDHPRGEGGTHPSLWMETPSGWGPRSARRPPPKKNAYENLAVGKIVKNPEFTLTYWPDVYPPPPKAGVRSGRKRSIEVIYYFDFRFNHLKVPPPPRTHTLLLRSLDLKICRNFTVGYGLAADRKER